MAMSPRDWDHAHLVQSYHVACLRSASQVLVHNARDRIGLSVSEIQRVFTHAASGKAQREAAGANKNGVGFIRSRWGDAAGRVETRFGNERLFVMQHPRPTSRATRAARATLDFARSRPSAPCGGSETLSDGRRWWTSKAQIEVEFYGGGDGNIGLVLGGVGS
jgi:hypothetical protein